MALTQDDGALGALGICHYFSQIPQEQRLKTLVFCIDTRHFIEGFENGNFGQRLVRAHTQILVGTGYFGTKKFHDGVYTWTQVVLNLMGTDSIVYDIV